MIEEPNNSDIAIAKVYYRDPFRYWVSRRLGAYLPPWAAVCNWINSIEFLGGQ